MAALGVLALILGVLLIVIEAHAPTAGVLGGLGALASAAGVWLLFTSSDTAQMIAVPAAAGVAVVGLGSAAVIGRKALSARRIPIRSGPQSLIGTDATVRSWAGRQGQVETAGGLWKAQTQFGDDEEPTAGDAVIVEQIRGLTLTVRRREPWELL
ncbi:NfeD family protein [Rhodococcus oxybenzonivorans]|jgi:membrane-bound ClpP family serine protease|uniref:Serine protease n=1 Tax=Rhodococcus oxybenzonivorans TaxID=1990687 RepID=A0A2S2BTC7_9NOCA|nr:MULTISPECIES: NfeD family protein [Rhodococcus]AWK71839.1 serine protease [Rhodococcus oxybenzonivorans]MDV7353462.1 NfeD family protein [Rhodococcus oxybenzonivorans]QHE68606.1 Putative membrane-bound ClpP-class protease [Rhodococcus sp. WAY2]QTJ65222.1 serine protease [Rhodococcus sp. ZPP]